MLEIALWTASILIFQYISFYVVVMVSFKQDSLFMLQQLEYLIQEYFGYGFMFYVGFVLTVLFWEILGLGFLGFLLYAKYKG